MSVQPSSAPAADETYNPATFRIIEPSRLLLHSTSAVSVQMRADNVVKMHVSANNVVGGLQNETWLPLKPNTWVAASE